MKYFSMFSGIGGFELGIQRAALSFWDGQTENTDPDSPKQGLESATAGVQPFGNSTNTQLWGGAGQVSCVGYSEIDKYAIKVYERNFNGHKNYGDATRIDTQGLPDFDLLVGGFPCQAFSIAGKRAGFNDTRGTLFFDIARILKDKRPRHLVLENVKGLLSHDSGKTFQTILRVLTDMGYLVEWQVLNSKNFGVPQNRERVFIIGHLGNECGRQVFPIGSFNPETNVINTVRTGGDMSLSAKHSWDIVQLNQPTHSNERVYSDEGISPTLNTMQGGNRQPFVVSKIDRKNRKYTLKDTETSGTLTATMWKGIDALNRTGVKELPRIRRLTPKECERLQGFPDNWTALDVDEEPISDTQRYKMCGNAVTVNVVETVMTKFIEHEEIKQR